MREIKFRAWDRARKSFNYIDDFYWFEENYYHNSEDNYGYTLQQFTGLKDKNGKEIYEGDVVLFEQNNAEEVVYDNENFCFVPFAQKINYLYRGEYESPEVVGNIFENPELL